MKSTVRTMVALVAAATTLLAAGEAEARCFYGSKLVDRYQAAVVFSRVIHLYGVWPNLNIIQNQTFKDVPVGYRLPVSAVASLGIMPGFEGQFEGKRPVIRYELALYLQRLLRELRVAPPGPDTPLDAVDLPGGHEGDQAAREAVWRGLIRPRGRVFDGHKALDRYEFAGVCARLVRLLQLTRPVVEFAFEDVPDGHPALPDIATCLAAGLLSVDAVGWRMTPEEAARQRTEALARLKAQPGPPPAPPTLTPVARPVTTSAAKPPARPVTGSSRPKLKAGALPATTPKPAPNATPAPKAAPAATPAATPAPKGTPAPTGGAAATPTPEDDFSVGM